MASRRRASTNNEEPPEPDLTTLAGVMATQTQLLQAIANNQGGHGGSSCGEFMRTKPPTFTTAEDPMEAEDWLRIIEKKLTLVRVREADKVIFAVNQLRDQLTIGGILTRKLEKRMLENPLGKNSSCLLL